MKATTVTMLGAALLAATFTSLWAAGKGQETREAQRPGTATCQLASAPVVTLTGTVRDLALPERGSRQGPAGFTLVSSEATTAIRLGPPHALAAAGLVLTDGAAVTVVGWQVTRKGMTGLVVRDLTIGAKTIILRTADGTPTWQSCRRGQGQGQGKGQGAGNGKRDGSCTAE